MATRKTRPVAPTSELGISGGSTYGNRGFTSPYADEFVSTLRGERAVRKYREMRENDPVIGATLTAMDMLLRAVDWTVEPANDSAAAKSEAEFVQGMLFEDMSHTWEVFISETLSFLPFGFDFHEVVYKRRDGPDQRRSSRRSKFRDGRIGVRKLAQRVQWTIDSFLQDEDDGNVTAVVQRTSKGDVSIPIERGLLFRTTSANNDPSGRSVLRNAYKSYHFLSNIMMIEAIAIERELAGLPVGRVPGEWLTDDADAAARTFVTKFEQILRDVKNNEQGYLLLPSDLHVSEDGNMTAQRMVDFELMASSGTRAIDMNQVIVRHQQDIARTVMADFLMLGQNDRGSFAMSEDKSNLFMRSLEGYLSNISETINRHLLTRVWALNGLNQDLLPRLVPGAIAPVNLEELGAFIQRVAGAGAPLFPDEDLENSLRASAHLPPRSEDPDMLGRPAPPEPGPTADPAPPEPEDE